MVELYNNKRTDMLKLGCTHPNLANICLHKPTNHKIFPFVEIEKDVHVKLRKDMTGGPKKIRKAVFTRKAVIDQTHIRNSRKNCKSIEDIDASQIYPFPICQEMPIRLYTRWDRKRF